MVPPVIGVVAHEHVVPRAFGPLPVTGSPPAYLDAVAGAGGRPVLLPGGYAAAQLDLVDALVLTGGGDLDPASYGASGPAEDVDRARDAHEIAVARAAVAAGVPVLGICRGAQVLVVAFGGTLRAGVEHRLPGCGHEVRIADGSVLSALLGARVHTSALHHQAVLDPGPSWRATAWAADGTIEAIEPAVPGLPVLGVQWHPELTGHPLIEESTAPAVFGWLVGAARSRSRRRPGRGR